MEKHTIITLKNQGYSNRRIQRELGVDRKTVAKYWQEYQSQIKKLFESDDIRGLQENITAAPRYDASNRKTRVYTEEIDALVDEILAGEAEKCRLLGLTNKQKLTSVQIHEMVRAAGHKICLTTISNQIRRKRQKTAECFIRQEYELGDRLEYDFGEVRLVIAGVASTYYLAVFSSPASGGRWAFLYTSQSKDVFMTSHVQFFEFVGGIYREMVYDNMRNVVSKFIGRSEKILNEDLVKMSLYYGFSINVTNCFAGNEKGHVEGSVKVIRNKAFAKKYEFGSLQDARDHLFEELLAMNKGMPFEKERPHLLPEKPRLELARLSRQKVDKYSFVRIENNFYSVPDYLAGREVDVKIYLDEIIVYAANEFVCRHLKKDGFQEMSVNIYHYLDTFQKKPGALKNSVALKSKAELKAIFDKYFSTRPKEFIGILKMHADKNINQLVPILNEAALDPALSRSAPAPMIEENINLRAKEQISQISRLFGVGGALNVN